MKKDQQLRSVLMVLTSLVLFAAGSPRSIGQEMLVSSTPVVFTTPTQPGFVMVEVKYGRDGKAQDCRIVRSDAPYALEISTLDFIQSHWSSSFFAGQTVVLPIVYQTSDSIPNYWDDDLIPPLDPLALGDPERTLKLRVAFGKDGWVREAKVIETSGSESVDRQTAAWVKVHWHHEAYASQTLDAPFRFEPPKPPAPVIVPPPPKPAAPEPPPEPVPIPAVRAQ